MLTAALLAPSFKWKRSKTLGISLLLALIAFIPSCTGIMFVVDNFRFGKFYCQHYSEVNDFRIERFLPNTATNITLHKQANGHHARYEISKSEFHAFIDGLWKQYGAYSTAKRDELYGEGKLATQEDFELDFQPLDWKPLANALRYHSPIEADGGGATYYYDDGAGIAYHRAGYW